MLIACGPARQPSAPGGKQVQLHKQQDRPSAADLKLPPEKFSQVHHPVEAQLSLQLDGIRA